MPKRVQQKQKQTVVVNIHSTKSKTRTKGKRKGRTEGRENVGRISSGVGYHQQILPPPIYTTPIHNLAPQAFVEGKQFKIPTLAEQQLNKTMDEVLKKNERGKMSELPLEERRRLAEEDMKRRNINPRNFSELSDNFSFPSSKATANSSSSSMSLTDYGSSNSPSLNSLAYFRNQHSDSSLNSDTISELSNNTYDNPKNQYEKVIQELKFNPIMREQPENRSLASSMDEYDLPNQTSVFDRYINAPVRAIHKPAQKTDNLNQYQSNE